MKKSKLLLAPVVAMLMLLSGCGGTSSTDDETTTTTAPPKYENVDEAFGNSFEIVSVRRNVDFDKEEFTNIEEMVLVELNVEAGEVFGSGFTPRGEFEIVSPSQPEKMNPSLDYYDTILQEEGLTPLPETVAPGESATGFITIGVQKTSEDLTFVFRRGDREVIGKGDKLPEKVIELELPSE